MEEGEGEPIPETGSMMSKLRKHLDVVILGGLVIAFGLGVVVYERGLSARDQAAANGLETDRSLYSGRPQQELKSSPHQKSSAATNRPWMDDEDANPRNRHRIVPRPLETGVVHLGPGAALGGRRPFPDDDPWNLDISEALVDPQSHRLIAQIGADKNLHPDFGAFLWNGAPTGIPYVVVSGDQPQVPVVYTLYGDESDPGPFPIPSDAPIEGDPNLEGDRHVIVIDRDNWKVYELLHAFRIADGRLWRADGGAVFDLTTNTQRPEGWTSADAAGLPVFPGLVRYDEVVELKEIRHALRFTVNYTRRAYVPPASHWASRSTDPRLPPMGMRVRLKANFDISEFPPEAQVILTALKKYGMILADNGGDWFISGAPDPRWNDEAIRTLKQVHGRDLEVVLMEGLVADQ